MNIIFTGPPLAGKGTQAQYLGKKLGIPVISIGALLRLGYEKGDKNAVEGYTEYAMKGKYLPIALKFDLIKKELDATGDKGFILENFPSTQEDLDTFNAYLKEKNWTIDKVFNIHLSEQQTFDRMKERGRMDDTEEIIKNRFINQERDRIPVVQFYKQIGKLVDINGDDSRENIHQKICELLHL